jgi:hypothetical protein
VREFSVEDVPRESLPRLLPIWNESLVRRETSVMIGRDLFVSKARAPAPTRACRDFAGAGALHFHCYRLGVHYRHSVQVVLGLAPQVFSSLSASFHRDRPLNSITALLKFRSL